ncbi:MAG: hypothetical protein Q9226_002190 [Calogaya cf. arnoldii]
MGGVNRNGLDQCLSILQSGIPQAQLHCDRSQRPTKAADRTGPPKFIFDFGISVFQAMISSESVAPSDATTPRPDKRFPGIMHGTPLVKLAQHLSQRLPVWGPFCPTYPQELANSLHLLLKARFAPHREQTGINDNHFDHPAHHSRMEPNGTDEQEGISKIEIPLSARASGLQPAKQAFDKLRSALPTAQASPSELSALEPDPPSFKDRALQRTYPHMATALLLENEGTVSVLKIWAECNSTFAGTLSLVPGDDINWHGAEREAISRLEYCKPPDALLLDLVRQFR